MAKIEDLHFGIMTYNINKGKFVVTDLFNSLRVQHSVATYVANKGLLHSADLDPLYFCFGDTQGRYEYEMLVSDLGERTSQKIDVYNLYVKPNAELLMEMVKSVDPKNAKHWLIEQGKRAMNA